MVVLEEWLTRSIPSQVLCRGEFISCCVVVRNIQRCVFAIPAPNVFVSRELALLEGAAESGGLSDRLALTAKLQVP